jgi:hypothetical protein
MSFKKGDRVRFLFGEGDRVYMIVATRDDPHKMIVDTGEYIGDRLVPKGMDYTIAKYPPPEYPKLAAYIDVIERDIEEM